MPVPQLRHGLLTAAFAACGIIYLAGCRGGEPGPELSQFTRAVDLTPLAQMAVQETGRLKSFDSFARGALRYICGPGNIRGQDPAFSYLDLMLRPQEYLDADIIYVKQKQVRRALADVLAHGDDPVDAARLERFQQTGLISLAFLSRPEASALLERLGGDLLRTAKSVDMIHGAMQTADPRTLGLMLRVIPPPDGGPKDEWASVHGIAGLSGAPHDAIHANPDDARVAELSDDLKQRLSSSWAALVGAWQTQDAPAASAAVEQFVAAVSSVRPDLYPDLGRLSWESWYFRSRNMTWVWACYLLAAIPLLMSVIYRWDWARLCGLVLFVLAFGLHTAAVGLRWYVAQRWPNSNMFEAVTTAAWFGGLVALVLEVFARRTALRNLFALASAASSMAAMMAAYYLPVQLNAHIGNPMPVLHDVWLYIHTNVIIASYCLIAMGTVSALLYLGYRLLGGSKLVAKAGGAGTLILGGAGGSFLQEENRATAGQVLDAATMVLLELSFVLLWAGIVMGAIWADHSWGRPWGWDPKEVFALNTFIIFLLLVHVRLKVRDKGLWTAVLAVVGCGVMLFNWIVVNFVITGLHSYA